MFYKLMSDKAIERKYVEAGIYWADAESYSIHGEVVGLFKLLTHLGKWEERYANRGYRTISLDDFCLAARHGSRILALSIKRAGGEDPVFHVQDYRDFLDELEKETVGI